MKKLLAIAVSSCAFAAFAQLSAEPYTCHWTGDAKNGNRISQRDVRQVRMKMRQGMI